MEAFPVLENALPLTFLALSAGRSSQACHAETKTCRRVSIA
jgi:hypothetical protein